MPVSKQDHEALLNQNVALKTQVDELTRKFKALSESSLDYEDDIERLESQHDVLENFCFGLEREHERARETIDTQREELSASYNYLRQLKSQQDDILEHVRQGILTVNVEGRVNNQYSRAAYEILGQGDLSDMPLTRLFANNEGLQKRLERFLKLQFSPMAQPRMLEQLNPLKDHAYKPDGQNEKMLSFSFVRIFEKVSDHAAERRIAKVMVVIDDITVERQLAQELERRKAEQAAKIEKAYQVLLLPPGALQQFVEVSLDTLERVRAYLHSLADRVSRPPALSLGCKRMVHTLKGNAQALNLESVCQRAHELEDSLELVEKGGADAVISAEAVLDGVVEDLQEGQMLIEKMFQVREDLEVVRHSRGRELGRTLDNLLKKEAADAGRLARLSFLDASQTVLAPQAMLHLKSALVQLVRNSIAHGVEPPQEREELGKDGVATVSVRIENAGSDLRLTFRDDGRGLDVVALKKRAVEHGALAVEDVENITAQAARQLVFVPGLSTASETTVLAGRGLGMDIVKQSVETIGGTVRVESVLGEFVEFVIVLPMEQAAEQTGEHEEMQREQVAS